MARNSAPTGLKVAIIGDSGVGKSTILSILLGESFSSCYVKTNGKKTYYKM
jgi:ABC-type transport system involved in cytochrome bd biosynthesis fused ATPase/permease subunit